ncbi:heavy metal-associated isoprenylated plant protein 28-like [Salvia hispanica]|uniref:heavy metal-associated isoprenylated plant protein 28-like n=1 Tax=Salvia hispanica TaxID=49212 RepID=UPI00200931FF|nr:heavy metal-associated isoprenylated plant protein 28-like [Salvia hispanica]
MSIVEMRVHMDCPGCERKITKALSKLDGVDSIDVDMNMQKVTVTGWASQKKVLKTVRKTGRTAELWPFPYNPAYYSHYSGGSQASYAYSSGYSTPATYFTAESTTSTYNYRKHGYNGHDHGYYQQPPGSDIIDNRTTDIFSDENATGCSVM